MQVISISYLTLSDHILFDPILVESTIPMLFFFMLFFFCVSRFPLLPIPHLLALFTPFSPYPFLSFLPLPSLPIRCPIPITFPSPRLCSTPSSPLASLLFLQIPSFQAMRNTRSHYASHFDDAQGNKSTTKERGREKRETKETLGRRMPCNRPYQPEKNTGPRPPALFDVYDCAL